MPKDLTPDYLDSLYNQANSLDQPIFDRFVSYGRLTSGDHFYQQANKAITRSASWKSEPKARLRLVQNHISRFVNVWSNSILDLSPDVDVIPDNPREEKDKKAASLNRSVKAHIIEESDFYSLQEELVKDFISLGESIIKISFEPQAGPLVPGQIRKFLDKQTGEVVEMQDQMPCGEIKFARIEPENLLRDPMGRNWNDARWLCHRHTLNKSDLIKMIKEMYANDPDAINSKINSLSDTDEQVNMYDGTDNMYLNEEKNKKILVREFYWRPCAEYPKGLYVMATKGAELFQSELPAGVFPIEIINFESNHGTPRGESRIKQLAPVQLEINRCVSKIAEAQITLGDDKIITTAGSKVAEINKYEGVRLFQVTGGTVPQIMEGRSGNQYLDHLMNQVATFDLLADIPQVSEDKMATLDPFAIFFLTSRQKKRFAKHATKFERFLIKIWKKTLKIHKRLIHPNAVIQILGASEKINMDEYKSQDDLGFQVKLKARTEDPESLIAKQFQINQFMQYGNLNEADFGVLAKESPFLDKSDLALKSTLKADRAQNMILKLDKGKDLGMSPADDPGYMLQRLDTRMSQPDFDEITYRTPDGFVINTEMIQGLYMQKRQQYLQLQAQRMQEKMQMEKGMIPTTGNRVKIQMYDSKMNKDGSIGMKQIAIPNDALEYLIKRLQAQETTAASLQQFDSQTQADLSSQMTSQNEPEGQDAMNSAAMAEMGIA